MEIQEASKIQGRTWRAQGRERKGEDWQGGGLASTQTLQELTMNQDFLNYLVSVSSTGIGKEVDDSVNGFRKITCYMETKSVSILTNLPLCR